jgi:acyl transferase domain-containing protein
VCPARDESLTGPGTAESDGVAVVGLSCRLPMAPDPDALWELLHAGTSAITDVPPGRWPDASAGPGPSADPDEASLRDTVRRGGFLDDVDLFDPGFFGISPREAVEMDPQQRLALELSWEALEDAGIVPGTLQGGPGAVYVGVMADDFVKLRMSGAAGSAGHHALAGMQRSLVANRVSRFLGVHGASVAVDTGQSSSLVAVHMACADLVHGRWV